jgi:hypothetical protein
MTKIKPCLAAMCLAMLIPATIQVAVAQSGSRNSLQPPRKGEQDSVRANFQRGTIQKLSQIEAIVVPPMQKRGAQYIGASFDSALMRYRLKFIRQTSVIWIDIDGRSGQIVAQAGN